MRPRQGFTLVELLMTISIISLLLTILAPGFKITMDIAKQTICLANLHGIHIGIQVYAEENESAVPPWVMRDGNVLPVRRPFLLTLAYELDQEQSVLVPGQLGHVHRAGLIDKPSLLYCPSQHRHPAFASADYYPKPWGSAVVGGDWKDLLYTTSWIAIGYNHNPHTYNAGKGGWLPKYRRMGEFPAGKAVAMDATCGHEEWVAHEFNGPAWNLLFMDGHAANVHWPERLWDGIPGPSGKQSHDFKDFNVFLQALESFPY